MRREPLWWAAFFLAYERTNANLTVSAELVGKTRQVVQYHQRTHENFRERLDSIRERIALRDVSRVKSRLYAA